MDAKRRLEIGVIGKGQTPFSTNVKWLGVFAFVAVFSAFLWHLCDTGVASQLVADQLTAAQKVAVLKEYFESFGLVAPVAYVAFVTVEVVVAPVPGTLLYAPGGMIFGGFCGGLLALTGNVLGAGIACCLFRSIGRKTFARFIEQKSLASLEAKIEGHGGWIVFLLRVNPLTSCDLVSCAAGLTQIPVWKVMLATLAGMAPLCFAQAYLAESVIEAVPQLIYPLFALGAAYLLFAVCVIHRLFRTQVAVKLN